MGRPPTPNQILKKRGSKHVRNHEPEFKPGIGDPPAVLRGVALDVWNETVAELKTAGIGSRVEAHTLSCYCQAVADFSAAQHEIDRDGMTVVTERGMTKHPAFTIKTQAWAAIHKFASAFGLTPSSRAKVHGPPKEDENEFDEF